MDANACVFPRVTDSTTLTRGNCEWWNFRDSLIFGAEKGKFGGESRKFPRLTDFRDAWITLVHVWRNQMVPYRNSNYG